MAGKQCFLWAYLEGDSRLRGYCTWLLPKRPRTPRWQRKKDKKGTNNQEDRFSDNRFLMTRCLHAGGLSPVPDTWDLLLPPGLTLLLLPGICLLPKAGHAAAALPLCFCLRSSEQRATGRCWIFVVTIPALCNSCFFSIFSIAHLPFSISLIRNSPPLPHLPD